MKNRMPSLNACHLLIALILIAAGFFTVRNAVAQHPVRKVTKDVSTEQKTGTKPEPPPAGPADEYNRGTPRGCVEGFFKAAGNGDFEAAARYLDMRNLPVWMETQDASELARKLKIVLDRGSWIDLELMSNAPEGNTKDGLPFHRELVEHLKTPYKTVDIILQRVPREDGVTIWKFSNRTVAEIPFLYAQFGYGPFEETLSKWLPDITFLGWDTWQWIAFLILLPLAYPASLVLTRFTGCVLLRKDTEIRRHLVQLINGPIRMVLWLLLVRVGLHYIGPSRIMRPLIHAGTLTVIACVWVSLGFISLVFKWWEIRLLRSGQESTTVFLRPIKTAVKTAIIIIGIVLWLDNIGYNVGTLLAGLGVGGIAVALAAQDTLRNFIGSIIVFLDRPFQLGQRIVIKGHDGVVEQIGLRSTRIRLLTGHLTTIPNEQMAGSDIENIGHRPHIRRQTNIALPYDTPLGKVRKAVDIIRTILDNHEGMDPEFPPRVYFNEFNPASINILILYWYHPPAYWDFLELNQRVNMQIMEEFEKEGIRFALPASTTYLSQVTGQPLQVNLGGNDQVPDELGFI